MSTHAKKTERPRTGVRGHLGVRLAGLAVSPSKYSEVEQLIREALAPLRVTDEEVAEFDRRLAAGEFGPVEPLSVERRERLAARLRDVCVNVSGEGVPAPRAPGKANAGATEKAAGASSPESLTPYFASGNVRIYRGDAREILPSLPKVGLILTDPPYAIGAGRGEWSATAAVAIGLHEAAKRIADHGSLLAFTTTSGRGIEFTQGAIGKKLPFNRLLVWAKTGGRSRAISPWRWDSVAILLFGRAPASKRGDSAVYTTAADYPRPSGHPAELPDGLADWLYLPFDTDDLITLDPFMGTGRLLEPAARLGRQVIGVELEERYCEIAATRLSTSKLRESV